MRRSSDASSSRAAERLPRRRSTSWRRAAVGSTHSRPWTTARCRIISPRETTDATGTSTSPTRKATRSVPGADSGTRATSSGDPTVRMIRSTSGTASSAKAVSQKAIATTNSRIPNGNRTRT